MKMERLNLVNVFFNFSSFTLVGHFDKDGKFRSSKCFWNFEFYSCGSF